MKSHAAPGAPRPMSPVRATALVLAVMLTAPFAHAQVLQGTSARSEAAAVSSAASTVEARPGEIQLLVGRSTVLNIGQPITRVSLTSPDVADAMVTSHQQLLVHGKAPGTITMFVWDRSGGIRRYEVVVQRDLSQLVHQVQQLFPGESITVTGNGENVVIAGTVSSKYVVDKAAEVAAGYVKKAEDVVNLLKQQEGLASQQVLLRVRFAEVSRSAMTELGVSLFSDGRDSRFARTTTQQFPSPFFTDPPDLGSKLVFSDYLNLFLFDAKNQLGAAIRALQSKGLFQSLAEPNLIAENGKEASFLAGGEFPYPVVQGGAGNQSITIQFKEFGVRLSFTPTIIGDDLVKLKVSPEVSSLDFANGVVIDGFRVPALSTRRTTTEIELQDGQTFAIAGLMNNTITSQMQKVPGIGDIPILGLLFRSKAAQKNQTELVVMITPQILRRNSTGVSPALPNIVEPFLGPHGKPLAPPAPWNPGEEPQAAMPTVSTPAAVAAPAGPAPAAPAPASVAPARASAPAESAAPPAAEPAKPTKEQKKELERARKEDAARRKAEEKAAKEQAKRDRKAAEEARKQQEKMAREQAKLEQELARRRVEAEKRQAEEDKRRAAEIAAAERRLKAAEAEYQSALGKQDESR